MSLMKIKFNPDLGHQIDAINAVVGVFEGQESFQSNFSVGRNAMGKCEQVSHEQKMKILVI
jgi:type III restriction enzyme